MEADDLFMRWEVIGADRTTGDERTLHIEADTEDSAIRRGNRQGLLVSTARPLGPDDSRAGTPTPVKTAPAVHTILQAAATQHPATATEKTGPSEKSWWMRQPLRVRYLLSGLLLVFCPLCARAAFGDLNEIVGLLAAGGVLIGLGLIICWVVMSLTAVAARGLKDDDRRSS